MTVMVIIRQFALSRVCLSIGLQKHIHLPKALLWQQWDNEHLVPSGGGDTGALLSRMFSSRESEI